MRPNGRSAHFIAPSTSNGCAMACAYCYVPRRKGFANPISLFVNVEAVCAAIARHAARQGPLPEPDTIDPAPLGLRHRRERRPLGGRDGERHRARPRRPVPRHPERQGVVRHQGGEPRPPRLRSAGQDPDPLLADARAHRPDRRRADLARSPSASPPSTTSWPPATRSTSISRRSSSTRAGRPTGAALFEAIDDAIGPAAKAQLKAEIILLTHNAGLHAVNLGWHPKAEDLLWRPDIQEAKVSEGGGANLRYRAGWKGRWLARFKALLAERMPYLHGPLRVLTRRGRKPDERP